MTTQLEQSLIADIPRLTADEQSALRFVLDRILVVGRRDYAPWQAEGDRRNMEAEVADELADAIVYTGMRAVMRAVRKRDRVDAFIAAAELAEMSPVPPVECDLADLPPRCENCAPEWSCFDGSSLCSKAPLPRVTVEGGE